MSNVLKAGLRGTGTCVPQRVLRNAELALALGISEDWIHSRTGIRERRVCAPDETSASLGVEAARQALEKSRLSPSDIDLLICATITPDMLVPSVSCTIQGRLHCGPIHAFDLNAACSGFLYALAVATQFIQSGARRHALVIGTDTMSRVVDFTDRDTCVLFGDGAGAAVLSAEDDSCHGFRSFRMYADGSRHDLVQLNGVIRRTPVSSPPPAVVPHHLDYLHMNGRELFRFAVDKICDLVRQAVADCGLAVSDIDLVVPHQANQRIIDHAFSQLDFPLDKVMVNLDRYGNTSAASIPIALDEALRTGRARRGDTLLLLAFGGGLTCCSAVLVL
jgi:3-oxoacyl-[acyl-carrier-protein] synthase-3